MARALSPSQRSSQLRDAATHPRSPAPAVFAPRPWHPLPCPIPFESSKTTAPSAVPLSSAGPQSHPKIQLPDMYLPPRLDPPEREAPPPTASALHTKTPPSPPQSSSRASSAQLRRSLQSPQPSAPPPQDKCAASA